MLSQRAGLAGGCRVDVGFILHEALIISSVTVSIMNRSGATARNKNQMTAWKQNVDDDDDVVVFSESYSTCNKKN